MRWGIYRVRVEGVNMEAARSKATYRYCLDWMQEVIWLVKRMKHHEDLLEPGAQPVTLSVNRILYAYSWHDG